MASRGSINKVMIVGNVVRDPDIKETSPGTSRCLLTVATNRTWRTESGEDKEDAEYHKIVAWKKLAEICEKIVTKGRKIYVEGRLSTREWETEDGQFKRETEIVMEDMVLLDSRNQEPNDETTSSDQL